MKLQIFIFLSFTLLSVSARINIHEVKKKYEHELCGQRCLFFPAKNPQRLFIIFTSAVKNKYERWSWFWRDKEDWEDTAYLFVKDDSLCWYLGKDEKSYIEDYSAIMRFFIRLSGLSENQIFTIGGSMGGYAAIFYATILGLKGAIVWNPQVDKESNWAKFQIQNAGVHWQDLDQVVKKYERVPIISLNCGSFIKDRYAAYTLMNAIREKNGLLIFRKTSLQTHTPFRITKKFIEGEIAFIENQELIGQLPQIEQGRA